MKTRVFCLVVALSLAVKAAAQTTAEQELLLIENGLLPGLLIEGEPLRTFKLEERMKQHHVVGLSMALLKDGKIRWAKAYGMAHTPEGRKVDTTTILQAGSISKPLAALAALKLVEEGKVDLDEDINQYLKTWQIPESEFTATEKVTLRLLLTHSAGMTVHGFPGYKPSDEFPEINQVLNGKGNTGSIRVDTIPGAIWRYSGGGYTVMEKMVEDVTGLPFEDYLAQQILAPLGMKHSTYTQPLPEQYHPQASAAYDGDGQLIEGEWHNYPEQAAAGLWTTPIDLAKYCLAIQQIYAGKTGAVLSPEIVKEMLTKHKNDWGLGPGLAKEGDSLIFQHGGKNAGFTNLMVAFANQGEALIVMTNSDRGMRVIQEILRAVSKLYEWGISEPKTIKTISLPTEDLEKFTGRYKYIEQVPGIGDYLIEVSVEDGALVMEDTNENETYHLIALSELEMMDLEEEDRIQFNQEGGKITGFSVNGRDQFVRMAEKE